MSGLILKDIYVLLKQVGLFLIITPLFLLSGELTAMFFIMMLFSVLPMTAMGYDEQSKWTSYATMLPYSKSQLVVSKYLLGYILLSIAIVISIVFGAISSVVQIGNLEMSLNINQLLIAISGTLTFIATHMFVNFRFGVEKGRIIYIIGFACLGALSSLTKEVDPNAVVKIFETPPIVFLLLAVIINVVSIMLSIKFKNK